jgi:polar amino acid transport system substrate-binding protein
MSGDFELISQGKLTVATGADLPPYSSYNELGHLDGLEIRVMSEISRRLGLEYEPVVMSWADIQKGLKNNSFDMSSISMDITPERQEEIDFCDGWIDSSAVILKRTEDVNVPEEELGNQGCGVLGSSTWVALAKERYGDNMKVYASNAIAVKALQSREVGLLITDELFADYLVLHGEGVFERLGRPLMLVQKGWAMAKGKPHLARAINGMLAAMIAEGTFQEMAEELIGYSPHPSEPLKSCA